MVKLKFELIGNVAIIKLIGKDVDGVLRIDLVNYHENDENGDLIGMCHIINDLFAKVNKLRTDDDLNDLLVSDMFGNISEIINRDTFHNKVINGLKMIIDNVVDMCDLTTSLPYVIAFLRLKSFSTKSMSQNFLTLYVKDIVAQVVKSSEVISFLTISDKSMRDFCTEYAKVPAKAIVDKCLSGHIIGSTAEYESIIISSAYQHLLSVQFLQNVMSKKGDPHKPSPDIIHLKERVDNIKKRTDAVVEMLLAEPPLKEMVINSTDETYDSKGTEQVTSRTSVMFHIKKWFQITRNKYDKNSVTFSVNTKHGSFEFIFQYDSSNFNKLVTVCHRLNIEYYKLSKSRRSFVIRNIIADGGANHNEVVKIISVLNFANDDFKQDLLTIVNEQKKYEI